MEKIVELNNVSKIYKGHKLLNDINLTINKGEITTLVGQNGAGKTTLAKIISRQEKISSGSIAIDDNVTVGYVPQKLDFTFNIPMTVKYLLQLLASDGMKKPIFDYEDFLNFSKIKHQDISELSGGELQKIILVGTILNNPDLLILDEPTQYLDVTSQQEFYKLLKSLRDQYKMTIFMISHDLFTVMKNSDQVICLNKHICCSGKPSDITDNSEFKNALSEIGLYVHHHDHQH